LGGKRSTGERQRRETVVSSDFYFDLSKAIARSVTEGKKKPRRKPKMQVVVLPPAIPSGSGASRKRRREVQAWMEGRG